MVKQMGDLEVIRKVHCPQEDRELEIDTECIFCDYYDGEDRIIGSEYVKCTFTTGADD
jgi:hypothetical protein